MTSATLEVIVKDNKREFWTVESHEFEEAQPASFHRDYWSKRGSRMMSCKDLYAILCRADKNFIQDFY